MPARSTRPLSSTSFYVLLALADADRYGLEIIDDIALRTGGEVQLGPGSLYNAIKRLMVEGLIAEATPAPDADPRRRYYAITAAGLAEATEAARGFEVVVAAARAKNLLGRSS